MKRRIIEVVLWLILAAVAADAIGFALSGRRADEPAFERDRLPPVLMP